MNLSFVYTLSDVRNLVRDTIKSLKSLTKFVDKKNIIIYYTPPRNRRNLQKISKYANVIESENLSEPFQFSKNRYGRFGESVQVCNCDSENVVLLDCDTIIRKNPIKLVFSSDYEFSGRIAPAFFEFDFNIWNKMFERINRVPIPMINVGFLIFKKFTHNKIKEEWLNYLNNLSENPHPCDNYKDQYSLSMAVSKYKIRWMNKKEHGYRWIEEFTDPIVLHGTKKSLFKKLFHHGRRFVKDIVYHIKT